MPDHSALGLVPRERAQTDPAGDATARPLLAAQRRERRLKELERTWLDMGPQPHHATCILRALQQADSADAGWSACCTGRNVSNGTCVVSELELADIP